MSLDVKLTETKPVEVFWADITHNLIDMANAAGIAEHVWRPERVGVTKACQLVEPLTAGIALMRSDPELFRKFDAKNGWGKYDDFLPWLESYLEACKRHPSADVSVSR